MSVNGSRQPLLEYGKPAKASTAPRKVPWVRWSSVGAVLSIAVFYGAYGHISICSTCGTVRSGTDWQIPMTEFTYWRTWSTNSTPITKVIDQNRLYPNCKHTW